MKKGISDIPFKWIFSAFVGVIIIAFFVRFAYQHVDTSNKLNTRQMIFSLDDQLNALSTSQQSNKYIDIKQELTLDCDNLNSLDFTKSTEKIIFAPPLLKNEKIEAWTLSWEFPFKIANLYYLSNKNIRYLLIYDSNSFNYVKNLQIPKIFNYQLMDIKNLDQNTIQRSSSTLQQVNLIFFTQPKTIKLKGPNVNTVVVDFKNKDITIKNKHYIYLNEPLLYGAIFAPESYDCLYKKSLDQLGLISNIYSQKSYYLLMKINEPLCRS
ncbi:MAG: hypothetical protein NT139_02430, partial [Candidatus Woesearchaeota archaeon]|nr:hypothetical protein [Candidatus Woesearchaeota archaeon]